MIDATELAIRLDCENWGELIFVREKIEGRFTTIALKDLSPELREKWVRHFIKKGTIPSRFIEYENDHCL